MCFQIKLCFYCEENFSNLELSTKVSCIRCKIDMHKECYEKNKDKSLNHTICPNCNNVGSLSVKTKQ